MGWNISYDYITEPRPEPVALAFQNLRLGQSRVQAMSFGLAWLGLAHGLKPGHAHHYFGPSKLIRSVDSLCMVLHTTLFKLCACQEQFQCTWYCPCDNCRHGLASDHTRWLACHVLLQWWHV